MREVLFKAKRVDNGEWVEGYIGVFKGIWQIFVPFTEEEEKANKRHIFSAIGGLWYTVAAETLCESTGLCDKNGKRIWENDIVNIEYPETTVKKCVIEYVGASFVGSTHADNWELDGYYDIEIIGNIFDDSELLTAERKGKNENITAREY